MKLSKNNKHFLSLALKDKTCNNIYSESKAASICCYTSDIIVHLSEKDLIPLNLNLDKIGIFSDLKNLFQNEENHKLLLAKTVIRSDNPFIISMLNLNKTSKIKYFIELICLNRIELLPSFAFFSDFFDKLHQANFLYLYQTNKLEEFAEIRFILQVESYYQKTFLISKDNSYLEIGGGANSVNEVIMNESDKNQFACIKKISMNNTTIKEVTEDEKNINNETTSRINHRSLNQDSMCNVGMNENSNVAANRKNVNKNNMKDKEDKNSNNVNYENFKTFSFKNNMELKNTLNLEFNSDSGCGVDKAKPGVIEENLKYNNNLLLDFKSKNSIEGNAQNISTIRDQKKQSFNSKQEDFLAENDTKNHNNYHNKDLLSENILEEIEMNKSKITLDKKVINSDENNIQDKSLKFDNNIDFNVEEKQEPKGFDFADGDCEEADKSVKIHKKIVSNIPEPEKEMESGGSFFEDKSKKSRNSQAQAVVSDEHEDNNNNIINDNKDLSQRSKNVFLTGKDFDTQQNLKSSERNNDINNEEVQDQKDAKLLKTPKSESRQKTEPYQLNNNEEQNHNNMDKSADELHSYNNNKDNNFVSKGTPFLNNLNENLNENEKEVNYNYIFSNNDIRSENKEVEGRCTNNFFSTNPHGTFYSTNKKREFPEDQVFEIKFNLGNYNFIYIDLDYTMLKNMKSNLEKISKFVQWAWEHFRYTKFVLYLPKIQDFFLDLNQDLLKDISDIFSIADILLFEKKELLSYKNILKDLSGIKKNQTASQFFSFNGTASTSFSNNNIGINKEANGSNFKRIQQQKLNRNTWEEFFLSEFKIKKRSMPLLVYPTKTLVILDELSSIIIYEKNYENKLIFKTETDFILYPQINHTNQNIIELYKNCLAENYPELRGIFFGAFLTKIMQKPVKVDTIVSKDYTGAYMISIELAKKFLKLFFQQKPYPINVEFYIIKLDKIIANAKLAEDIHRRRESKFVLDCVNRKKSFLKFYEPLNDQYLKDFFSLRSVSNTMRNFGFEKNKGKFIEPEKNSKLTSKTESLKIGGKFFIGNNKTLKNLNGVNNINNAFDGNSNYSNLNLMGIGSESPENNLFSNYNSFNLLANLNSNNKNEGKKGNSLLTRAKLQNMNLSGSGQINFNASGNNFYNSLTSMQKPNKVHSVFGKNITVNLPKLVTSQVKIDPEEQMRNYVEFEKNIIIN